MSGDEISERFIVGIESFLSLGIAFLSKATGTNIPPLSTPAICHLYGSDTPTTEFFLETSITAEDDVCVASDWLVLLFQFLVIHALRSWSRWLLEPLARKYLGQDERSKRVETFARVSVQLTLCVLSAWFAWRILSPQPWIWKSSEWIPQEYLIVAPDLKFHVLFYTATLFSDLLSLKHTNKGDMWFYMYAVNHVVGIALVLGSAMAGYSRICCVLLLFIDWASVFRHASILCHYLSTQQNDGFQFVANRFYEVYGILFFVTRNVLLSHVAWIFATTDAPMSLKALFVLLVLLQAFQMVAIGQTLLNQYLGKGSTGEMLSDEEDEQRLDEHRRMVLKKKGKRKIH